jgi:hypothetical protein
MGPRFKPSSFSKTKKINNVIPVPIYTILIYRLLYIWDTWCWLAPVYRFINMDRDVKKFKFIVKLTVKCVYIYNTFHC